MQKVNLTNEEADLLKRIIPKRIDRLNMWDTPEQYRRNMWPIAVTDKVYRDYQKSYKTRQKTIQIYKGILGKLS